MANVGRKQRNTVEYFPHYVGDSKTKSILKSKYGSDGYSTWFQLLEILCKSKEHYFDCRDEWGYEWILSEIGIDKNTFENIMDFLARFEKIDPELWQNKIIWCQNLVNNLERVYDKRVSEIPRKPLFLIRKCEDSTISGAEIDKTGAEMTQSTVQYSKGKESRVEDSTAKHSEGNSDGRVSEIIPYDEIITDLNDKSGKSYRSNTETTRELIRARWKEGFRLEDFQKVHTNQAAKWKGDPERDQYLRPATLYRASKFEGYLNGQIFLSDKKTVSKSTERTMNTIQEWVKEQEKKDAGL